MESQEDRATTGNMGEQEILIGVGEIFMLLALLLLLVKSAR